MKKLDVQTKLECAVAGVAVLRALQLADKTMTYGQFSEAIGLLRGDGGWRAWHQNQISDVLYLMSAAQGEKPGPDGLQFDRLMNQKGHHGKGLGKKTRIVKS